MSLKLQFRGLLFWKTLQNKAFCQSSPRGGVHDLSTLKKWFLYFLNSLREEGIPLPESLKEKVGGSLLWLVTRSRLDIAYSHSRIASLQTKDTLTSWEMLHAVCSLEAH
eukprot:3639678-Amphidinium_carterae.1